MYHLKLFFLNILLVVCATYPLEAGLINWEPHLASGRLPGKELRPATIPPATANRADERKHDQQSQKLEERQQRETQKQDNRKPSNNRPDRKQW